jgi:hypothetical protein
MTSVKVLGGALEALRAKARSVQAEVNGCKSHIRDAVDDFWHAAADLGLDLFVAADELEGEEGGADIAGQLRDLAEQVETFGAEISDVGCRAEEVLDGMEPIAEALDDIFDPACAPDNPADDGDDAGE